MPRDKLVLGAPKSKRDSVLYWKGLVARNVLTIRAYKARLDSVVMALGHAQSNPATREVVVEGLMTETLAVSKKRVSDRVEAVRLAVEMLGRLPPFTGFPGCTMSPAGLIGRMRELAPEAFGPAPEAFTETSPTPGAVVDDPVPRPGGVIRIETPQPTADPNSAPAGAVE